jgi:prepilin-type N-terminal cleavage/methylation domain-containing protein
MKTNPPRNRGFTLIEVMLVGMMMGVLAIVLSSAWSGLGQPAIDVMVRCQVEPEAQIAAMSLAADCGGRLPVSQAAIQGSLDGEAFSSASISGGALVISFTGGSTITYRWDQDQHTLVRETAGATTSSLVIASNVYGMLLEDEGSFIQMTLTFQFRDVGSDKYRAPYSYIFFVPMVMP